MIYGFGQMGLSNGEESTLSKNLNKVDFSKFFSNTWVNVFMMINVVLGLFLLDHYLTSKKKQFRKADLTSCLQPLCMNGEEKKLQII